MNKIIYLDTAASMQKPQQVIQNMADFLGEKYANAGRGVCERVTNVDKMIDGARNSVADFIGADKSQIVWTGGATDALNRIVNIVGVDKNTVVGVSDLDHHSARLPFVACGGQVVVCPLDNALNIDTEKIPQVDVLIVSAMSNVIGVAQDVQNIVRKAREKNPNVIVVVDATQFVVHCDINVKLWDADFVVFSGHKIGADTGVGVMYMKEPCRWRPDKFGGGMVKVVNDDNSWVAVDVPECFEAGTLPLTQISGLVVAIDCLKKKRPDLGLIKYMYDELQKNKRVKIISPRDASLLTFVIDGMHVLDFGALVGAGGVCLRVGNMCASWIHKYLQIPGSVRISVGPQNTEDEVKRALEIIKGVVK